MTAPLGLIAGGGGLPRRVIAAARRQGRPVFVIALDGQADPALLDEVDGIAAPLGAADRMIAALKAAGVHELAMAGAVRRPALSELKPDWRAAKLLGRIGLRALGDDGLLRAISAELEAEGFRVIGPQSLLDDALAPSGPIAGPPPDDAAKADISRGIAVLRALGYADAGQGCVVQQGMVLAIEAAEGTDAMIARAGALARSGAAPVLIKGAKRNQDPRLDPPVIGPDTLTTARAAGLAGLAVEAGRVIVIEPDGCAIEAERAGLFLYGFNPGGEGA